MDEFSKMIAAAEESVKLLAPVMSAYFEALVESGFTREEALVLTVAYQTTLLSMAGK